MSKIEQIIDELENYIDQCKFQPLSNTKILVNKEEVEELILELRMRIPDEIKKYQKIINQQEAILSDARIQAQNMINDATQHTNELVSDHEIMQRAYQKAAELIDDARMQADEIVGNAVKDANEMRYGAMQYTDNLLNDMQKNIEKFVTDNQSKYNSFIGSMQDLYDVCSKNRADLDADLNGGQDGT